MRPSLRTQRLRLTWFLAVPFLWLAHPSPRSLLLGFLVALPGLLLRLVASGYIDKDQALAQAGPFALVRHPLYLGSFFSGLGLALATGRWEVLPAFLLLFGVVYGRTVRWEEAGLALRFGNAYRHYRGRVPSLVPWPRRRTRTDGGTPGFSHTSEWGPQTFQRHLFIRNRGWEAPLGVMTGLGMLWAKMAWFL